MTLERAALAVAIAAVTGWTPAEAPAASRGTAVANPRTYPRRPLDGS